jgi:OmpA-OmpF porin, OOP family
MNIQKALAAGLLALAATLVQAAGPAPQPPESGFYVGAGIGHATAKDWCSDAALAGGAARCDDKDTAWRVLVGYQFSRHLAVEAGHVNFGKMQATTVAGAQTSIQTNAYELMGLGILPIGGIVSAYGKLGLMRGEARGGGTRNNLAEKSGGVTFGAGVQAHVFSSFAVRGEWQRYPKLGGGLFGASTDINVLSVLGIYRF